MQIRTTYWAEKTRNVCAVSCHNQDKGVLLYGATVVPSTETVSHRAMRAVALSRLATCPVVHQTKEAEPALRKLIRSLGTKGPRLPKTDAWRVSLVDKVADTKAKAFAKKRRPVPPAVPLPEGAKVLYWTEAKRAVCAVVLRDEKQLRYGAAMAPRAPGVSRHGLRSIACQRALNMPATLERPKKGASVRKAVRAAIHKHGVKGKRPAKPPKSLADLKVVAPPTTTGEMPPLALVTPAAVAEE
jgi:hypothetical protein